MLKNLLARPDFAPAPEEASARAEFVAELDDILARLTAVSQVKESLQDQHRDMTARVNELDGRIYHNLLLLSRVGEAVFRELNDHQHPSLFRLQLRKRSRSAARSSATPPAPAPQVPPPDTRGLAVS